MAAPFVIIATVLFYAGTLFAYFFVFRAALAFFISFATPDLKPMIGMKDYTSLVIMLMLAFGAVFETPIVIVFLGLLGLVNSAMLRRGRRYFIVLAFIIAAVLSPTPDVINQTFMAIPMLLFYEVGIVMLGMIEKRRKAREETEALEEAESSRRVGDALSPALPGRSKSPFRKGRNQRHVSACGVREIPSLTPSRIEAFDKLRSKKSAPKGSICFGVQTLAKLDL